MERYCDQQTGSLDKLKNKNWKYITGVSAGRVAKKLERPNIFYIFEKLGSRMSNMTFKYDNPIQFGSSPFNSSPQCKNGDIKGSFRRNFWKLGNNQFWWKVWNSFFKWPVFLGGIFGRKTASDNPLFPPFCPISGQKRVKENMLLTLPWKGAWKPSKRQAFFSSFRSLLSVKVLNCYTNNFPLCIITLVKPRPDICMEPNNSDIFISSCFEIFHSYLALWGCWLWCKFAETYVIGDDCQWSGSRRGGGAVISDLTIKEQIPGKVQNKKKRKNNKNY